MIMVMMMIMVMILMIMVTMMMMTMVMMMLMLMMMSRMMVMNVNVYVTCRRRASSRCQFRHPPTPPLHQQARCKSEKNIRISILSIMRTSILKHPEQTYQPHFDSDGSSGGLVRSKSLSGLSCPATWSRTVEEVQLQKVKIMMITMVIIPLPPSLCLTTSPL